MNFFRLSFCNATCSSSLEIVTTYDCIPFPPVSLGLLHCSWMDSSVLDTFFKVVTAPGTKRHNSSYTTKSVAYHLQQHVTNPIISVSLK